MNKAAQAYFQTKVNTTDQGHLLIMLYDGALKYLQQARDKMLAKDYAAKGVLISKVIDIVNELASSLNMEKGGDLSVNLNNLYILCTARLLQANMKMNIECLDSVVKILSGLRSAYAEIVERPEAQKASQQIAKRLQPVMVATNRKPQPVMQMNSGPVSAVHARAAYGRSAMQNPAMQVAMQSQYMQNAGTAQQEASPADQPAQNEAPQRAVVQQFMPKGMAFSRVGGYGVSGR
ncbi:MAG: flagellar export chaperone FliS [Desulfovibrio sp.]|nr:flagellar export chaperone FliS [Desulfovibrio sp.]